MTTPKSRFSFFLSIAKAPVHFYIILGVTLLYFGVFGTLISYVIQIMINQALYQEGEISFLLALGFIAVVCVIFMICMYLSPLYREKLFQYTVARLRKRVFHAIMTQPFTDTEKMSSGDYLTKLMDDCDNCCTCITRTTFLTVELGITMVFGIAYIFYFFWPLALFLLAVSPAIFYLNMVFAKKMKLAFEAYQEAEGSHRVLFEEIYGRRAIIPIFRLKNVLLKKHTNQFLLKYSNAKSKVRNMSNMITCMETTVMVIELLILVVGVIFVRGELITLGVLLGVWNVASGSLIYPAAELPFILGDFAEQLASIDRVRIYSVKDSTVSSEYSKKDTENPKQLQIADVSFGYEADKHIIDGISFSCKEGELVYVVGESGSGKSTLLKLILNLYTPRSGTISVQSEEEQVQGSDVLSQLAYVPQDSTLFNLSIQENLTMGNLYTEEQINTALQMVNMKNFVQTLPKGIETVIQSDRALSSGQAQRIAIARAILKDAPFLIMDEPYANLDSDNKEAITVLIQELVKTKGVIIVSHDTAGIEMANKVITLQEGGCYAAT